jgi:hypothetical protein
MNHIARTIFAANEAIKFPFFPTLHHQRDYESPTVQYLHEAQYEKTVADIVRRARNVHKDERDAFIQHEIDTRLTDELIRTMGGPAPARAAAIKTIQMRLGMAEGRAAKGMAVQQMNKNRPAPVP